jgi:hypothetical protein
MTITRTIHLDLSGRGREKGRAIPAVASRVPRIARLMALAIRMENLIRVGGIIDYSQLAQLGHVSRARITQIMNLLLLAPDIQEQILFVFPARGRRDPVRLAQLQPIARIPDWSQQRQLWATIFAGTTCSRPNELIF